MKNKLFQISALKENLESAAFLVSKGNLEKEAHAKIVQSLVLLNQIELQIIDSISTKETSASDLQLTKPSHTEPKDSTISMNEKINDEVKKVEKRVPRWFKNPSQYNSRILNCFLKLHEQNCQVTSQALRKKCHNIDNFDRHYPQMKNFSKKNHGKVFEESNEIITLWKPVKEFILEEYKKSITV